MNDSQCVRESWPDMVVVGDDHWQTNTLTVFDLVDAGDATVNCDDQLSSALFDFV